MRRAGSWGGPEAEAQVPTMDMTPAARASLRAVDAGIEQAAAAVLYAWSLPYAARARRRPRHKALVITNAADMVVNSSGVSEELTRVAVVLRSWPRSSCRRSWRS